MIDAIAPFFPSSDPRPPNAIPVAIRLEIGTRIFNPHMVYTKLPDCLRIDFCNSTPYTPTPEAGANAPNPLDAYAAYFVIFAH